VGAVWNCCYCWQLRIGKLTICCRRRAKRTRLSNRVRRYHMGTNARLGAILGAAAGLVACSPYVAECSWFEPTENTAWRVLAPREPTPTECQCLRCDAPGDFRLLRDDYVLELWNGDRWYPQLFIRARTEAGQSLVLISPDLLPIDRSSTFGREREFDYWVGATRVQGQEPIYPKQLQISVVDADGRVLGTERLSLRLQRRKHLALEFI
jgi:hypothetical protein